jgi:CBS-domain-containing membrane protein
VFKSFDPELIDESLESKEQVLDIGNKSTEEILRQVFSYAFSHRHLESLRRLA